MPSELVTVDDVLETLITDDLMRYDINVHLQPCGTVGLSYTTTNPWLASLCQQCARTGQILQIVWKDSRYGKQIVAAEVA